MSDIKISDTLHFDNTNDYITKSLLEAYLDKKEAVKMVIEVLKSKGYKITSPPKEVRDEYTFERAWDLYDKKVGNKEKLERKWNSMSKKDRKAAIEYIPLYVISKPDKQFRKNFQTFLNQEGWNDELIGATPPPASINEKPSEMSQLIARTKDELQELTEDAQDNKLRKRICGMIEVLKNNPQSSCRIPLEIYRDNGTMERLGIQWMP